MSRKIFWLLFGVILVFAFVLRIYPTQGNNFFFTMDQGDDAVHAREFWQRGQILLKGPETGIRGVFAGPGWYYFISLGYKLFNGHPFGALFMVITLSLATTAALMWQIGKNVGHWQGLLVGLSLQGFWPFYDTSRWAFNPFVLVFLSVVLILLLVGLWQDKKHYYLWAVVPIGLAFNAEVAGAAAMFLFYAIVGLWALLKRKLDWKVFGLVAVVLPSLIGGLLAKDALIKLGRTRVWSVEAVPGTVGTFSGTNFTVVGSAFLGIVRDSTVPQSQLFGVLGFLGVLGLFFRQSTHLFVRSFVFLSLGLFVTSYFFFASNKGWQDWHDLYLPPLLFVSLLLMLFSLWRELKVRYYRVVLCMLFGLVVGSQLWVFGQRYTEYLRPSDDPSILTNQLEVLDWIYTHNEDDGFNLYTASANSFYDYQYQYLVWWYGRGRYGFVPCEYANFPKSIKYLYVPGSKEYYSEPRLGCDRLRFLIVEPGSNSKWIEKHWGEFLQNTKLVDQTLVGSVRVEKREKVTVGKSVSQ